MCLKANEYADAWEYSKSQPCPPEDYPKTNRVTELIDTFLENRFFDKIVIWGSSRYFQKIYHISPEQGFRVVDNKDEIVKLRIYLEDSCISTLFSVIFVPFLPEFFMAEILKKGHYNKNPTEIYIGDKSENDWLAMKKDGDISFFKSELFRGEERLFSFTPDAQFLLEIFLKN